MGMKLLSQTQAQAEVRGQRVLQATREREASSVLNRTRQQIAQSEADFHLMLASQQERWEKEEQDHLNEVSARKAEIKTLEDQKTRALIPVDKARKEAEDLMQVAQKKMTEAEGLQAQNERTQDIFEQRLDDVADREQRSLEVEKKLERRVKGIEAQEAQSKANAALVSEAIEKLRKDILIFDKMVADTEAARKVKDAALKEREQRAAAQENANRIERIKLQDAYEELAKSTKEIHERT